MYVHVFAVDLFLRNTADIIFSHDNMKSGGLWLFQKFPARGLEVRVAGSIICGSKSTAYTLSTLSKFLLALTQVGYTLKKLIMKFLSFSCVLEKGL